jgi:hypothetical protein
MIEIGVLTVVVQRLIEERLPRALSIKDRVERGERISDRDLEFLELVLDDARKVVPLLKRHPRYESVAADMGRLYQHIVARALENEQSKPR